MPETIDIARLRWVISGRDVTCENCHTALYRPLNDQELCPACRYAAGEDLYEIVAHVKSKPKRKKRA